MFLIRVRMHVQYPGRARGLCLQGIFVMVKEGDTAVVDTKNILLKTFFFSISRSAKLIHIYFTVWHFIFLHLKIFSCFYIIYIISDIYCRRS